MAKINHRIGAATSSAAGIAAALLAVSSSTASAQQDRPGPFAQSPQRTSAVAKLPAKKITLSFAKITIEYKLRGEYWVAGDARRHNVFEDGRGNLFYIDAKTGDQKFVVRKAGDKILEYSAMKYITKVRIVGVDTGGNVIMKNAKGENFYLDPANGDFIFVHNVAGR